MINSCKLAVGALGTFLVTAGTASAMPIVLVDSGAPPTAQTVAWGCGPGWHPNPWGRCVPNVPYYGWGWGRPWNGWGWHHWHRW